MRPYEDHAGKTLGKEVKNGKGEHNTFIPFLALIRRPKKKKRKKRGKIQEGGKKGQMFHLPFAGVPEQKKKKEKVLKEKKRKVKKRETNSRPAFPRFSFRSEGTPARKKEKKKKKERSGQRKEKEDSSSRTQRSFLMKHSLTAH